MGRIDELIGRIEAGEQITPAEVNRIETLLALDLVARGDQFVADTLARQAEADQAASASATDG